MDLHCPLCHAKLRDSNPGPFCSSRECTRAQFALQAFLTSEANGTSLCHVTIQQVTRDPEGIYAVWCRYHDRRGRPVTLEGVRFNQDGIPMGQHIFLGNRTTQNSLDRRGLRR